MMTVKVQQAVLTHSYDWLPRSHTSCSDIYSSSLIPIVYIEQNFPFSYPSTVFLW